MSSVPLHASPSVPLLPENSSRNTLPQLLQTPSGLALLELQGTINLPDQPEESTESQLPGCQQTPIGRLVFPDYDPKDASNTAWMKRVYLYVGKHQRLTGEVKKLPKAIAVIRKRIDASGEQMDLDMEEGQQSDELEIVEIVKHKILFSTRPEPVGTWAWGCTPLPRHPFFTPHLSSPANTIKPRMPISPPEQHHIPHPTPHVPNSPLPVLIYRSAIPLPASPALVCSTIEPHHWLKGGIFKHYPTHHFHSVTHECYAVFKGHSKLLLGQGPLDVDGDEGEDRLVVEVAEGDAIVLPAGVAHCCLESSKDYEYVGLYPEGSPHWDNNFCRAGEEETMQKARNARAVPVPDSDPVFGVGGPLVGIWKEALG
ncbi:Uncharacterized protein LSUB1_G005719, partial [Lachnellula subtilissima]